MYSYKTGKLKSLKTAEARVKNLREFFGGIKAINIGTSKINAYIAKRREDGVEDSTINRECRSLRRMFSIANDSTPPKLSFIPKIPNLKENDPRQGYFEHHEYLALKRELPYYLKPVLTMGFKTGMRAGEILNLQWSQVDLLENKITLRPVDTKNQQPRIIYLEGELLQAIHFQQTWNTQKFGGKCPWVFPGKKGERIKDFRDAWKSACIRAGLCKPLVDDHGQPVKDERGNVIMVKTKIFHDNRRTAVRNMEREGIPRAVSMRITGHRTQRIFDRYNIVNENDLKQAAVRREAYDQRKFSEKIVKKQDEEG